MPTSPKTAPAKPRRRPARHPALPPKPYHHGDLKRVLIDAALLLAEEGGAEAVSVSYPGFARDLAALTS